MRSLKIACVLFVLLVLGASAVNVTLATEPSCSSTQLDNKVLTDVDCWIPGQIQKRCLQQTNKCCNASEASDCGAS